MTKNKDFFANYPYNVRRDRNDYQVEYDVIATNCMTSTGKVLGDAVKPRLHAHYLCPAL